LQHNLTPKDLTTAIMKQISVEKIGREVALSDTMLQQALDPENFVKIRTVAGGVSASATSTVLDDIASKISEDNRQWQTYLKNLESADRRLISAIKTIIN
jgi:hypothetical protein